MSLAPHTNHHPFSADSTIPTNNLELSPLAVATATGGMGKDSYIPPYTSSDRVFSSTVSPFGPLQADDRVDKRRGVHPRTARSHTRTQGTHSHICTYLRVPRPAMAPSTLSTRIHTALYTLSHPLAPPEMLVPTPILGPRQTRPMALGHAPHARCPTTGARCPLAATCTPAPAATTSPFLQPPRTPQPPASPPPTLPAPTLGTRHLLHRRTAPRSVQTHDQLGQR